MGDIHGMFTLLYDNLMSIGFDPKADRLFSVGDLADRGAESAQVLDLLAEPWFHPVMGNHEEILILHEAGIYSDSDLQNVGASWWLSAKNRPQILAAYKALPLAIEVETLLGPVGIIHAECPFKSWSGFKHTSFLTPKLKELCLWSPESPHKTMPVEDVRAVLVGHMTRQEYSVVGNTHLLDTGAVYSGGHFTILELESLKPV